MSRVVQMALIALIVTGAVLWAKPDQQQPQQDVRAAHECSRGRLDLVSGATPVDLVAIARACIAAKPDQAPANDRAAHAALVAAVLIGGVILAGRRGRA